MSKPQTPESRKTAIAPMLSVRNGARAVEFYKAAFGAEELFRVDDGAGHVVAQLSLDGAEFWLADESPEHLNFSPDTLGGGSVRMILIVEDPDEAFQRAVAAGAKEFGRLATNMAGAWDESSIPSDTIGKSASP